MESPESPPKEPNPPPPLKQIQEEDARQRFLEETEARKKAEALQKLDPQTVYVCASIAAQVGFQHFEMWKDTRLEQEARRGHRFVSANCEEIAKKLLRLLGVSETEVEGQMNAIGEQIMRYRNERLAKKGPSLV